MEKRKRCTLAWCTADHGHDSERVSHHEAIVRGEVIDGTTVAVVALWAERLDGRIGVNAHIAVIGSGDLHEDLTPCQARDWAHLLTVTGGRPWLAEALATGAELLAPHDDHESDGAPHRVADNPPVRVGTDRFTYSLIIDVFDALERHGYRKASDAAGGRASLMIGDLADVYEGGER